MSAKLRLAPVLLPALAVGAFVASEALRRTSARPRSQAAARPIPRGRWPDSTLALLRDGYEFIPGRCERLGSDIFRTRLMLQKTICLRGEDGARLFYNPERFRREGAAPRRLQKTLFGKPGIQVMDGEAHRHRKQMFMSLMTPQKIDELSALAAAEWKRKIEKWRGMEKVILFDEARELLCRAVCTWTGTPISDAEVRPLADDLEAMIDSPGRIGPRHFQGRLARRRAEKRFSDLIEQVRAGDLHPPEGTALQTIALYRDLEENPLDSRVAAVELLNILRPTVAVSRYVVFLALALLNHPEWRQRLHSGEGEEDLLFVQEVRRISPFFPFVAARVKEEFDWQGYRFPRGTRVILDLYGTSRHPDSWEDPESFRPERFRSWNGNPFDFIPQGGGDTDTGHRCAGEKATIELMKVALAFLARSIRYEVPDQDLKVSLSRMPAIPKSRFEIAGVRAVG